jgi:hypothetical protein
MKKHRNPSFPTGLLIGAVLGAGALIYWATRATPASTAQALNARQSPPGVPPIGLSPGLIENNREYLGDGSMSYHGDVQGRVLTPAEIDAINANPTQPLLPAEAAMLAQMRANFARVNPQ